MPGTITPIWRRNGESNQDVGIMLHIIPAYCPQLGAIERLWDLMHRHVTHNTCHATVN